MTDESNSTTDSPSFRQEKRHEFRYQLAIFLADVFSWIFWLIPRSLRYWLADRVADVFHRSTHTYRDNVQSNIAQVLGTTPHDDDVVSATRQIFRTSARNFTDLITMPRTSRDSMMRTMSVPNRGWAPIDEALLEGRGVILVACHLGSFDHIGQVIRARGYRLTIVTGRTTSRFIFDGVTHLRGSMGSKLVEPTPGGIRKVIRALRNNECAVIVSDRDYFQNGRPTEFFGRTTTLPPGAIRIARDTGASIIPIMTRRLGTGHELSIQEPFKVEKTANLEADMAAGFARLVPIMEQGIRERVSQWVMFQRVWPTSPPPLLRVFPEGSPLESELLEKVVRVLPERHAGDVPLLQNLRSSGQHKESGV